MSITFDVGQKGGEKDNGTGKVISANTLFMYLLYLLSMKVIMDHIYYENQGCALLIKIQIQHYKFGRGHAPSKHTF